MRTMTLAAAVLALPLAFAALRRARRCVLRTLALARVDETIASRVGRRPGQAARRVADAGARRDLASGTRSRVAGGRQRRQRHDGRADLPGDVRAR